MKVTKDLFIRTLTTFHVQSYIHTAEFAYSSNKQRQYKQPWGLAIAFLFFCWMYLQL